MRGVRGRNESSNRFPLALTMAIAWVLLVVTVTANRRF